MVRRPAAFAATIVFALLAAGCAGRASQAPVPTPPSAAAEPATVSADPRTAITASGWVEPPAEPTPTVTIGWVGDTTPGSRYGMPPRRGRALFEQMRAELSAPDIMVANLEGTYGSGGTSKGDSETSFSFQAPASYAPALAWAGIDLVSVANNHASDYLERGMRETQDALDDAGVAYTGLPGQITVVKRKGVRVAFIAASPYRWNQSLADVAGTARLVRRARTRADVVIVLMHAGAEGSDKTHTPKTAEHAYGEFRGNPRVFAHAMVDAGACVVLGSGPHVIRGIERYKGKLIAYSLGNFGGWGNFGTSGTLGLSGLLRVEIDRSGAVFGGRWVPLKLTGAGVPEVDPKAASTKLVRKLSAEDFSDPWPIAVDGTLEAASE